MSPFLYTFFGCEEYGSGRQFFKFFKNIRIVNSSIYKRCKLHKGFYGKYIFLMGPEVKKTGCKKLLQHKNAATLSQVIFCA